MHPAARELLESAALAHLVTLNPDGSPQVSGVWVGLDGDEIVSGHMMRHRKVRNIERDPRVALSLEAPTLNEHGLKDYLVVHGRARIEPGGAAALLQGLAHVYMGPDVVFPPGAPSPEAGFITRITPERFGGVGPWA
jgi:PPOX class probable F420-dependent enzyme